ncbi:MAG: 4Fe-4S cluster-binding domain-containing protein [bacterium]
MDFTPLLSELETLRDCALCPRNCHADRFSQTLGYCKAGTGFSLSSICIHRGEEPVISGSRGICNIFFTNCNLQCIYCQNDQISNNHRDHSRDQMNLNEVLSQITRILATGINIVGFVSPSHFIPQMKIIIQAVELLGYQPTWVFNTNGYDKVSTLRTLEGIIDVYLPDFKYIDSDLARQFSDAPGYPEVAAAALKEMYRQKGSALPLNKEGYAESGILIRHLVLPGQEENTRKVLSFIAEEVSPQLHIGLMSQYYPTTAVYSHPVLGRSLSLKEYRKAIKVLEEFGLHRGFIQGMGSFNHYRPDFDKNHPFEPD